MKITEKIAEKLATSKAEGIFKEAVPNPTFGNTCAFIAQLIPQAGAMEVRKRMIAGSKDDFEKEVRKNPKVTVAELTQKYRDTPECVNLMAQTMITIENIEALAEIALGKKITPEELDALYPNKILKATKIGRNELCPCGSGVKYKKCCGK